VSSQTVARRYATALADVIIERKEEAAVRDELALWSRMIQDNPLLLEALSNPTVAYEHKSKILTELIKRTEIRQTTTNFLRLLLRNQRLAELPQVNERLTQILDERAGMITAQVVSAREVSEPIKAELEASLSRLTKRKVKLDFQTDESLLGGIVTRIGSTIYDGSVRNQLDRLEQELAG
jgi:F-type H+-transporting ATPase subunit delta